MKEAPGPDDARRALGRLLEAVLASRAEANAVFDILAVLQVRPAEEMEREEGVVGPRILFDPRPPVPASPQSERPEDVLEAVRACTRLFGALLQRGELFVGQLPPEDTVMAGGPLCTAGGGGFGNPVACPVGFGLA